MYQPLVGARCSVGGEQETIDDVLTDFTESSSIPTTTDALIRDVAVTSD